MTKFILRRMGISFLVLLGGSLLLFVLTINSGDPIEDLRESNADNRDYLIRQRTAYMGLDQPWYSRYWEWLTGAAKCVTLNCDLGTNRNGVEVTSLLGNAASSTLRLVVLATVLAIVIGITVGILTAIRQYSGFDYVVTFLAFLFFSLPVFWAAVLLKEYGAIRFNDWIVEPTFTPLQILVTAGLLGIAVQAVMGGDLKRRALTAGATLVFVGAVMYYFSAVEWFRRPAFGAVLILVVGVAAAVGITALLAGLKNRKVMWSALTTVGAGLAVYFAFLPVLREPTWLSLLAILALVVVLGAVSGWFWGGYSRRLAMGVSVAVGVVMAFLIVVDRAVAGWMGLLSLKSRPISTIGSQTPNFTGDFWESFLDKGVQIILPTIVLTLVSVASYTRYTRSSMLEVLEQDYVRTARSKGLSERVVIVKHAFRNALIPITTIVAFDFAGLIGGAIITEQVFGWKGMGELFQTGLKTVDPAPVMAFFLVTGTAAVLMNLAADLAYAGLDPRIRR
ncbi:peptide/nickel transport system permease protein [Flavimobilis marinus]|uniref:Peptide/nickel transport system permease protein n=1 Tax=Flavimobilis marinus TaxID=285351 RepID=A0A1I2DLM6_9MICO|nr:ABC transporter permease [Flavimobilis marinus]SFE81357.1 peptide/nickel transport system permease protein [Flavimobilis marinus]